MLLRTISVFFLITIDLLNSDMTSLVTFHSTGTNFIPVNPRELLDVDSSSQSESACAYLCHRDPRCRTFVFDSPTCRLYEGSVSTGQIVPASSSNSVLGEINYDDINLSSAYNQSCDHCYPDRYLVCTNNRCQCPSNTFWNGHDKCINQQFVDPTLSCMADNWCREDMNLTCTCNKCQCPLQMFWNNESCIPQFLQSVRCNTSDQCRNDLQLVCSRVNKTCLAVPPRLINVTNAYVPAVFAYTGTLVNISGNEWWNAFDNNPSSYWNADGDSVPNYLFVTFDDKYLLTSMQLTAYGDITHDPEIITLYSDENGTCFAANFSYAQAPSNFYTYPADSLSALIRPIMGKNLLIDIAQRWTKWQTWLPTLRFYGIPY